MKGPYKSRTDDDVVHYARRYNPRDGSRVFIPWCWPYVFNKEDALRNGQRGSVVVTCLFCLAQHLRGEDGAG